MKYMGSKRSMLTNGLGVLLDNEASKAKRFVDLFCGSAAVSEFVAARQEVPVMSVDLQHFSASLAEATVGRTTQLDVEHIWKKWLADASKIVAANKAIPLEPLRISRASVNRSRAWCESQNGLVVTKAYGGHYFSPTQAVWIDALMATLPKNPTSRAVSKAALIRAVSKCAAAPGHTAQPFQPTQTALPFLEIAWKRDFVTDVSRALTDVNAKLAKVKGAAVVADAVEFASSSLLEGDLVFIDPPYSGVHYSRFYHVLETVSRGSCGEVTGTGRYPAPASRPRSDFSMRTTSTAALKTLLGAISKKGASAIVTFPDHDCSNGLSGNLLRSIAGELFKVEEKLVKSRFSTLGGVSAAKSVSGTRAARQSASELILVLRPC